MQETLHALPLWAPAKKTTDISGLGRNSLLRLVRAGKIESRKVGGGRSATRLYKIESVLSFIEGGSH